jgi:virulence factor Mce-like protein
MMRRSGGGVQRLALWALVAGVIGLVVVLSTSGGKPSHKVTVVVPNATDVLAGQYVKAAGVNVGTVSGIEAVDGGRAAKVTLTVDNSVWPLTKGTTMTVRWGGTASFVNRYINLVRGPVSGPAVATDGVFPAADFKVPVEFDSFLDTFTPNVRTNLKELLNNAGIALKDAGPNLKSAIGAAPAALTQASAVLSDLNSNEPALNQLVRDGSSVVSSINASNPGVASLISNAASTFSAFASRTEALETTLQKAPGVFEQTRTTLAKAEPTLQLAKKVTSTIAPGVEQVDADAKPLDGVLVTLRKVGPDAISALSSAKSATPSLNPLLTKATSLMPELKSIGSQATNELQCIRPYTPDIVAFTSDWGDFLSGVDGKDHYFRAMVQSEVPAPVNIMGYDSATMHKDFPWVSYAYPPPPGYAAGQPWYLSQCNEGPNTLNPDDDPENNTKAAELPPAPSVSAASSASSATASAFVASGSNG